MSIYNLTAFEKKSQKCINMALGLTPSRTILQKCNTALTNDFQKNGNKHRLIHIPNKTMQSWDYRVIDIFNPQLQCQQFT